VPRPTRQQVLLTAFRDEYNDVRSHEGLDRKPPASCYEPSARPYSAVLKPAEYTSDQQVRNVRQNGEIKWGGDLIYISLLLAKHRVAICEVAGDRLEVRYRHHLLGRINPKTLKLESPTHWHGGENV
jgi:hypothetical protein